MFKAEIPVILESVSRAKDDAKDFGYANFLLTGGNVNVGITEEQFKQLENMEGEDMVCSFKCTPKLLSPYRNNSKVETWFKPVGFLGIIS